MKPDPDPNSTVPGMGVWGWMSIPELEWLMGQARLMDSVAEIGSLHGRSAVALATVCAGPVYCIDPWNDENDHSYPSFLSSTANYKNIVPVREMSPAATVRVPDVDMVFIDGAHAYGDVLADIAGWLPKTKKLICGHDFIDLPDAGYPGVAQAVKAVFGDRWTCAEDTSIWAVDLTIDRTVLADAPTGEMTYENEYGRTHTINLEWP